MPGQRYALKYNDRDGDMVEFYYLQDGKAKYQAGIMHIDMVDQFAGELNEHGEIVIEMVFIGDR